MKIISVVGARPQFIKYFGFTRQVQILNKTLPGTIEDVLLHTGQHYDYMMSKVFFDQLGILEPRYHLEVGSGMHGAQTGRMVKEIEDVLFKEKPDAVLVFGDTNSTLAGALAASKNHIPVVHVESGLRSFNKLMPEEVNRICSDHVSSIMFCPSKSSVNNLLREGFQSLAENGELYSIGSNFPYKKAVDINNPLIINTGDIMYDVILASTKLAQIHSQILMDLQLQSKKFSLLTIHRAESTDDVKKFEELIMFVNQNCDGDRVIFPMHPRTREKYNRLEKKFHKGVQILNPVPYFDLLQLLENARMVMTDSGGVQKEAYWLKIPCITLRDRTEWIETVSSGWNVLYHNYSGSHVPGYHDNFYGDGHAGERIVKILCDVLSVEAPRV